MSDNEPPNEMPPDFNSTRMSPGPTTGGQVFEWEEVPEELRTDPKFWYAHYRNIEGSYRDMLKMFKDHRRNQQFEQRATTSQLLEKENPAEELKSLFGIGAGMFTLLFGLTTLWEVSLPPSLLFGGAVTLTYIADRLSLPKLLQRVKEKSGQLYGE